MFEQVREMIDSTIYTNGKGEVTAQNVNLAFHGVIDAAESQGEQLSGEISQTNDKVAELSGKIDNVAEGGLGGLTYKLPIEALGMLSSSGPVNKIIFDRETINIISETYPSLAEPLEELFNHNAEVLAKYIEVVKSGKPAPILSFDCAALIRELSEAMGGDLSYDAASLTILPTYVTAIAYMGESMMMAIVELDGTSMEVQISMEGFEVSDDLRAWVYIPSPEIESIDNDEYMILANQDDSQFFKNDYRYVKNAANSDTYEPIFPVHVKKTTVNLFLRFVIDSNVVETIINKKTGLTRTRVIATMTPADVEQILEGDMNISNPIISADTTVVNVSVYSDTPWLLYLDDVEMLSGEALNAYSTYPINVTKNTEATSRQLQLKLVAANSAEVLDTEYVTQEAAVATVEEEQTTE